MPQGRYGMGQLFQSASQALGITGMSNGVRNAFSAMGQLGLDRGGLGERLNEQVAGETDEQRRRRMREQQGGLATNFGQASLDLFGGMGGLSY